MKTFLLIWPGQEEDDKANSIRRTFKSSEGKPENEINVEVQDL